MAVGRVTRSLTASDPAAQIGPSASPTGGALTHCPYCALQCGITLTREGERTTLAPRDFPVNKGALCLKGWTAAETLDHPERLLAPLVRGRDGELRQASWDEALERVVTGLAAVQHRDGPNAAGVFGGGSLTNEKAYLLGKFARVALGTSNVDYNGRFCMSSAAAAGIRAFGIDRGLPFPLDDIAGTDVLLLVGSNVAETMPPAMQYFEAQRLRGGKLIVIDPRATPTAQAATLHLQITPGTDAALANGLLHILIRDGLVDRDYVAARTSGFDAVRAQAARYWPERVERVTGVPERQLVEAAHLFGRAASAMVLTSRGTEQQASGVDNVLAFINLALVTGRPGRPHSGYGCVTGQGNGQGGREHGQKADQLPGYRKIDDPADRRYMAAVWGIREADLPASGKSAYEMLDTLGEPDGVRALVVMGSNPAVSAPNAGHVQARLRALDLLVVADFFLSETAALADVVLPSAQWAEEEGTTTNLEGRVLRRQRLGAPPAGVWTDTEILCALAERLGRGQYFQFEGPRAIFEELRRATAGGMADYSGITYQRIEDEQGVFWPCVEDEHPGTPRLFQEQFATPDGRAHLHAVEHTPAAEEPDEEYPLYLITGRVLAHYQSGTQTRRVRRLREMAPEPRVEIHPETARRHSLQDGDEARLTTRRGQAPFKVTISPEIRTDTIFVPFHWGGAQAANLLTNPALDPISRMPEFKVCAVRLESASCAGAGTPEQNGTAERDGAAV